MLHRSRTISFHALCLLPALALTACDPKLNLGDVFDEDGQGDIGQSDDQGDDDQGGDDQGGDDQGGDDDQGDEQGDPTVGQTTAGSESDGGDESSGGPDPVECDVWAQDCPEGQKCTAYDLEGGTSWDALKCVPIDPSPVPVGAPCENPAPSTDGLDNCEEGAMCWDVDENGDGTCVAFCQGSERSPSCAAAHSCAIANEGVLPLCLPDCDPLLQNCGGTDTCVPLDDHFLCVLDASGPAGAALDPCEFANACDPGFICADSSLASECDPMIAGCCLPFCDVDDLMGVCPGAGQTCVPWYPVGTAPPGQEDVGLCSLP